MTFRVRYAHLFCFMTIISHEFSAVDREFISRTIRAILSLSVAIFGAGFYAVSSAYAMLYAPRIGPSKKMDSFFINGLPYMGVTTIVITVIVCLVLVVMVYLLTYSYNAEREIVIGVKFVDAQKQLIVTTKTVAGKESTRTYQYAELILKQNHIGDGMTGWYGAITLKKDDYWVGHIYLNHFTWDAGNQEKLKDRLEEVFRYE